MVPNRSFPGQYDTLCTDGLGSIREGNLVFVVRMELNLGGGELMSQFEFFSIISILVYLILFGLGVYALVLFIKMLKRGIKALDLYIEEKSNRM